MRIWRAASARAAQAGADPRAQARPMLPPARALQRGKATARTRADSPESIETSMVPSAPVENVATPPLAVVTLPASCFGCGRVRRGGWARP